MRATRWSVLLLILLLAGTHPGRGQDASSPAAILDKAIAATGGATKLAKLQAMTIKGKGLYHDGGQRLPFALTWYSQGADKYRQIIEMEVMGLKSEETWVLNGNQGWRKLGPTIEARALPKDELEETKDEVYFNWITTLAPLKGKEFKLTALEPDKVDGRPVVGFTVSRKGNRDAKLYFDKETGLLAKGIRTVKDEGKDIVEEMLFFKYAEVDGIKMAMKTVVRRDSKPHAELDVTEAKMLEKLDEKLFTNP
jgi:hypothetical protein